MRPIRLIRLIGPILLLFLAVFFLLSKPESQQGNTIVNPGTSGQQTPATQATIQGPKKNQLGPKQILLPSQPLKIQQITPVKYAMRSLKQDVIEIGTERHSPPKPYLKLSKWEGEANLKVSIPYNTSEVPEELDGKLRYRGDGVKIDFYPKAPQEITEKDSKGNEQKYIINEEGGVEFDTILDEKPASNQIVFPLETQGLKFYYQPPLNEENKDPNLTCTETTCTDKDGNVINFRPEHVVGSYAVYHEGKTGDYSKMGGKNYKAGKAFHIYRPRVTDAEGNETWGELNINTETGTLTIIIDQAWLNSAVYPVTIDPNFGYETNGGTNFAVNNSSGVFAQMVNQLTASTGDTITGYSFYISITGTSIVASIDYAAYSVVSAVPSARLHSPDTKSYSGTLSLGWSDLTGLSHAMSNGVVYSIGVKFQANSTTTLNLRNDSGSPPGRILELNSLLEDPWVITGTDSGRHYSVYATYTTTTPTMDFSGVDMQGVNIN